MAVNVTSIRRAGVGLLLGALLIGCAGQTSAVSQPTDPSAMPQASPTVRPLPVQSLPDLVISGISVDWDLFAECADPGIASISAFIEVSNVGSEAAPSFRLEAVGTMLFFEPESAERSLRPGEALTTVWLGFPDPDNAVPLDQQQLTVTVDPENVIQEADESNNTRNYRPSLPEGIELCPTPMSPQLSMRQPVPYLPAGEPLNLQSIHMFDANRGWGIAGGPGADQHVLRTEDGGQSWFDVSPPELTSGTSEAALTAFGRMEDINSAWVGYGYSADPSLPSCHHGAVSALWHTTDGGSSWSRGAFVGWGQDIGGDGCGFPTMEFVDARHGWAWRSFFLGAGSSNYQLFRTTDGGVTWQLMPDDGLFRVSGLDFTDRTHGWATISYPLGYYPPLSLAQTHDGGEIWERSEVPLPGEIADFSSCSVHSPALRSATAGELTVSCETSDLQPAWYRYRTDDGGNSWQVQSIPEQPDQYVSTLAGWKLQIAPSELQAGEGLTCILVWTQDGGRSWSDVATMACDTQLDFVSSEVGWALTTIERGVTQLQRTDDGGHTWEPMQPVTIAVEAPDQRSLPARITPHGEQQPISVQTAERLSLLQAVPAGGLTAIGSYPPTNQLFTAHQDGTVTFWDLAEGGYGRVARLHDDWIYDLAVGQRSRLLATASKDGHVKVLWLYGIREVEDLTALGGEVASVAVGPDGTLFAIAGQDGVVRVLRIESPDFSMGDSSAEPLFELRGHQAWVWDVAFSPDGKTIASGSADRSIRIWDVESGELLQTLAAHDATVGTLAFSPDGSQLASAAWDGSLIVWETVGWEPVWGSSQHDQRVYSLGYSIDGSLLATGAGEGELFLWSASDGELLARLPAENSAVRVVFFDPGGRLLFAASDDEVLGVWGIEP